MKEMDLFDLFNQPQEPETPVEPEIPVEPEPQPESESESEPEPEPEPQPQPEPAPEPEPAAPSESEPESEPEPQLESEPEPESAPDENSGKLYYTIGEVAAMLGEATSLVRFWSDNFPKIVRPKRTMNKNNRLYTARDVAALRKIHYLVKECGMTLEGARRKMKTDGGEVDYKVAIARRLGAIRESLKKIHDEI